MCSGYNCEASSRDLWESLGGNRSWRRSSRDGSTTEDAGEFSHVFFVSRTDVFADLVLCS